MKKKTEIYNGSYGRKWKSTWVILILILSIISLPAAGEEDNTGRESGIGLSPEHITEENHRAGSSDNAGMNSEKEFKDISDTDSQETTGQDHEKAIEENGRLEREESKIKAFEPEAEANEDIKGSGSIISPESRDNEPGSQEEASNSADYLESVQREHEPDTELNNEILNEENGATDPGLRAGPYGWTQDMQGKKDSHEPEIGEDDSAKIQEISDENSDPETGDDKSAGTQEAREEGPEPETGEDKSAEVQENTGDKFEPLTGVEEGIKSPVKQEATPELGTGEERTSGNVEESPNEENEATDPEPKLVAGNEAQDQQSTGDVQEPEIGEDNSAGSSESSMNAGLSPEKEFEEISDAESQEIPGKGQESDTGLNNEIPNREKGNTDPESKFRADGEGKGKQSKGKSKVLETGKDNREKTSKNWREHSDPKTGEDNSRGIQEAWGEHPDLESEESDSRESQENIRNNLEPRARIEERVETPLREEMAPELEKGEEKPSERLEEKIEHKTGINNGTDSEGSIEENQETGADNEAAQPENAVEIPEKDHDKGDHISSSERGGAYLRLKEKAEDRTGIERSAVTRIEPEDRVCSITESPKSTGVEKEQETQVCNGTKVLESKRVKLDVKTIGCNLTGSLLSREVKPEIRIYYWVNDTVNNTVNNTVNDTVNNTVNDTVIPEIEQDGSSWNNLRFILSYLYSPRSFYTVNESVKISYEGPETFRHQNVDVYLVKAYDPGFPEGALSNGMNGDKVDLGKILSSNTEFYIEIPASLNGAGDLSPLTLGPLPAGSYQTLVTLAGNDTEKPEPEKELLSTNYFEVLEYEMEARAPYTLGKDESFEVKLNLRSAPAQTGYTYWAVLVRADALKTNEDTVGRAAVWARPFVNGVDIITNMETGLTANESGAGKEGLKSEMQALIGEENGAISIGKENQSTLSLTDLGLPPGEYILFAGAHEKDRGLAGLARKEVRISSGSSHGAGLSSLSGSQPGNTSSMRSKYPSFLGISSIFETPGTFISENIKPYIQAKAITEVIRNPPKIPSFLLGFTATLLIGLAILRIRK